MRDILGATLVEEADKNTIRGKYGIYAGTNLVHASDSVDTAKKELELWKEQVQLVPNEEAVQQVQSYIKTWIKNEIDETEKLRKICTDLNSNPDKKEEAEKKIIELLKIECVKTSLDKIKILTSVIIDNILCQD